jgi:hypothetical protein
MPNSSITAMTGGDVLKINDRILNDFFDGECVKIDPPNDLVTVKVGKGGNAIIGVNNNGRQQLVTLRLIRGNSDDKYLNGERNKFLNNPGAYVLLTGEYTKNTGDGGGGVSPEVYLLTGGIFKKQSGGHENADGETEQGVVVYEIIFSNVVRSV